MNKRNFILLLIVILAANFTGLFNEIITGDSALYATISKSFSTSGNYIDIFVQGKDWLDKPHFPFWISALSMDIFGVNTFAFKFPSFLFFILCLIFTYKLAKQLYNTHTARLATVLLGASVHVILSNNDVRAEPILMALIMAAVYYLYNLSLRFSTRNIILASIFCAAAIMTKGIFVLIIIYSAIFGHLLVKKEFNRIFQWKWGLVLLLTFIFTLPELYAVYNQFDLHPERVVFGETNVSGLKFFIWDSQFGRFFNTGPIKGKGDLFFFAHTTLWAFAPWALLSILALVRSGKSLFSGKQASEYVNFFGFITMFAIFSISKFQLPHYLNIIFPFLAIQTAALIASSSNDKLVQWLAKYSINLYSLAMAFVVAFIGYIFRPNESLLVEIGILIGMLLLLIYFNFIRSGIQYKHVIQGVLSISLLFLYINLSIFPTLLQYQSGAKAAQYANKEYPEFEIVETSNDYPLEFYSNNKVHRAYTVEELKLEAKHNNRLVYIETEFLESLQSLNIGYSEIKSFEHYHITKIRKDFFNHKTRDSAITKRFLVRLTDAIPSGPADEDLKK